MVKDPFQGTRVVFSSGRSKRPHRPDVCPFCPGNEKLTPPSVLELPGKNWRVRAFPNAFPVVKNHEVIVESPVHGAFFEDFSKEQLRLVFQAYQRRFSSLSKKGKYVLLFRNFGDKSGASIPHEHAQILSFDFVPDVVRNEIKKPDEFRKLQNRKALAQNEFFTAFCPPFSRFPWETWILAKNPDRRFESFSEREGVCLLSLLQDVLRRVKRFSQDYTVVFHAAPVGKKLPFHAEVLPRKAVWGGIELGAGVLVNFKPPADALADLKKR